MKKNLLGCSVLDAAKERLSWLFDNYEDVSVTFSGGKDSTVMLHLVLEEAKQRNRKVKVVFIDWEAQFNKTIQFVEFLFNLYTDTVIPIWVCVPLKTTNACSTYEPEWICWEPSKKHKWVRELPDLDCVYTASDLPFYTQNMTFEEFIPAMGKWLGGAILVGIRTEESLNRSRVLLSDRRVNQVQGRKWINQEEGFVKCYPIYDWTVKDIWVYTGKFNKPFNPVYDSMHRAGVSLKQARICEPYGDEQRKGLWLYQIIEPETWPKLLDRVAGANTTALYSKISKNKMMGNKLECPKGHTWKSYSDFLLSTLPHKTANHYKNKIAKYIWWWTTTGGLKELPDLQEDNSDVGSVDGNPSWRRVCRAILKNDYWAASLGFAPTKTASYEAYTNHMKDFRKKKDIYAE